MASLKVPTLEALAEVIGVHRRTLADYAEAGCPIIKTKGGYALAPTLGWYGRMLQRRQLKKYFKRCNLPSAIQESLDQILEDHERAWTVYLNQKHRPST